jgi:two-component system NarL family response regulator
MSAADIRVMIVDDHPLFRGGVRTVLGDTAGMEVVAEAASSADAEALYRSLRPDVTLVDLRLPDTSGAELISRLRADFPDGVFVVLTAHDGDEDIYRALKAGARGYLRKDTSAAELGRAIRSAHGGGFELPADLAQRLAQRPTRELSTREVAVLELIVRGKRNSEIATSLGILDSRVRDYVRSLLGKLGVPHRTAAATEAVRRGIVRL